MGGFLERISVTAFEKYHREITDLVRTRHGVYALYKNDRLYYYVSLAVNLRRRIKQHLRDKHAGRWNRFSLYLVRKVDHIKEIESLLLRIAGLAGNKQGGRLRKATNLEGELRRMMEKRQRAELDEIFSRAIRTQGTSARTHGVAGARRPRISESLTAPRRGSSSESASTASTRARSSSWSCTRMAGSSSTASSTTVRSLLGRRPRKCETNGWTFWRVRKDGEIVMLSKLRKQGKRTRKGTER